MALLFALALVIPFLRHFYELATPTGDAVAAWALGTAIGVGAMLGALRLLASEAPMASCSAAGFRRRDRALDPVRLQRTSTPVEPLVDERSARRVATSRLRPAPAQSLGAAGTRRVAGPARPDSAVPALENGAQQRRRACRIAPRELAALPLVDPAVDTGLDVVEPQLRPEPGKPREQRCVQDALTTERGMQQAVAPEHAETELDDEQRRVARARRWPPPSCGARTTTIRPRT